MQLLQTLFGTKATVGAALFNEQFGIFSVEIPAFSLNIGTHGTAYVGSLVVLEAALPQGIVDHVHGALDKTFLVCVLNAENELAA